MDALTVPFARPKAVLAVMASVGVLAIGAWAFSRERYVVGIALLYFMLPLAFHINRLLSARTEALVIDKSGLTDYTPLLGVGFISWSEVQDVELRKRGITSFLNVKVHNASGLLGRVGFLKRLNAWFSSLLGFSPILINLAQTYGDPQQIMEKVREARAAL